LELSLGTESARLVDPEDMTGFAVVVEGAAMLDFARTRGWVDDELGAVRGHVERR
jgi:hypothetical protein